MKEKGFSVLIMCATRDQRVVSQRWPVWRLRDEARTRRQEKFSTPAAALYNLQPHHHPKIGNQFRQGGVSEEVAATLLIHKSSTFVVICSVWVTACADAEGKAAPLAARVYYRFGRAHV